MKLLVVGCVLLGYTSAWIGFRLFIGLTPGRGGLRVVESFGLSVGAAFWVLNPWIIGRLEQLGIALSALGLPLIIGLMASAIRSGSSRRAAACGLLAALVSVASPHYLVIGVLSVAVAWTIGWIRREIGRPALLRIAAAWIVAFAAAGAFAWTPLIATIALQGQAQPGYVYETDALFVSTDSQTLWNVATLTAHHFFGVSFRSPGLSAVAWSIASLTGAASLVAVIAFDRRRRARWAVVGSVTATLILLLGLRSFPFGEATYDYVARNLLLGWLIREPDKVAGLIPLGYAIAISWAIPMAVRLPGTRSWPIRRAAGGLAVVGFLGLLVVWSRPAVEATLWGTETANYVPVEFPAEYYEITDSFAPSSGAGSSVFVFSRANRSPFWSKAHVVRAAIRASMRARIVTDRLAPLKRLSGEALAEPEDFAKRLGEIGVGAVMVAVDDVEGMELADRLATFPGLAEVGQGKFIRTFDLDGPSAPLVEFAGSEPVWIRESATSYRIEIPPRESNQILVVREQANALWAAYLDGVALDAESHGLFNAWSVPAGDPGIVQVSYRLQAYVTAGYTISALTVLAALGYFTASGWRRLRRSEEIDP